MWWKWAAQGAQDTIKTLNAYYSAKLNNASLKYQASMNRINARLANMSAESALRAGEKQQQQIMTQTARLKGAQKTGYAANGIDLNSRSVQNVLNETDFMGEVDKNQAAANALTNAWGYRLQATNFENNANILKSQRQSPWGAAFSTMIQAGLSRLADSDYFGGDAQQVETTSKNSGFASLSSGIGYSPTLLGSATGANRTWGGNWLMKGYW